MLLIVPRNPLITPYVSLESNTSKWLSRTVINATIAIAEFVAQGCRKIAAYHCHNMVCKLEDIGDKGPLMILFTSLSRTVADQ